MSESITEDKDPPPPIQQEEADQVKSDQEPPNPSDTEPSKYEKLSSEPKTDVATETTSDEGGQKSEESPTEKKTEVEAAPVDSKAQNAPAPPQPSKIRHDWYQTERDVCVNIMIKKLKKDNVRVNITETTVSVSIKLEGGKKYTLELNLAHPIVQAKSTYKVLSTKVEIKLRKSQGLQWKTLEATNKSSSGGAPNADGKSDDPVHKYPSSSHYTRDWDKLVAEVKDEEKNEKPEGDAALNKLFQQIYGDGSDEVKKAMNKSFVESGGTVLSTNWGDIGKEKVERKPPDGMEWRDYEN